MIFPSLRVESKLQTNDRTRLDGSKSFEEKEPINEVKIQPEAGELFYDVTEQRYLDWQYATAGEKLVTIRLNNYKESSKYITVVSPEDDKLFSSDQDIQACEPDIINFVKDGRNSYLDKHREAQFRILNHLNEKQIWNEQGQPLTKENIYNIDEVRLWSKYWALEIIYTGLSEDVDDIYQLKSEKYAALREKAQNSALIRLDYDADGEYDNRFVKKSQGIVVRR
jgi:hypothetical protein